MISFSYGGESALVPGCDVHATRFCVTKEGVSRERVDGERVG